MMSTCSSLKCLAVLRKAFDSFDKEKKGCIHTDMVGSILELFGHKLSGAVLRDVINEVDVDGKKQQKQRC